MLISLARFKQWRSLIACSLLLPVASTLAEEPKASLKMPKVTKSLLLDVEKAGHRLVAVGERGHILFSDDKGLNWQQADVPTTQMVTAVSFADSQNGWAVAHDGHILQTTNGAESWTLQRDGLGAQAESNIRMISTSRTKISDIKKQMSAVDLDPALLPDLEVALEDAEWELESSEEKSQQAPIANPLLDVWFMDAKKGWAVGAFGQFLYTTNGGISWLDGGHLLENEMGYHLNAVSGTKNGMVYIGGESGFLSYSNNSGEDFQAAEFDSESSIFQLDSSANGKITFTTGLRAQTFFTSDQGLSWQQVDPNINFSLAGVEVTNDGAVLLVGAGGSLAFSGDNGKSFQQYTVPSRVSLSSAISLDNGDYLIVGEGGVHTFNPQNVTK